MDDDKYVDAGVTVTVQGRIVSKLVVHEYTLYVSWCNR